jgi:hypothetical protein
MKAFILSMIALVAIGTGAWLVLLGLGWTAADVYSSSNVRL